MKENSIYPVYLCKSHRTSEKPTTAANSSSNIRNSSLPVSIPASKNTAKHAIQDVFPHLFQKSNEANGYRYRDYRCQGFCILDNGQDDDLKYMFLRSKDESKRILNTQIMAFSEFFLPFLSRNSLMLLNFQHFRVLRVEALIP